MVKIHSSAAYKPITCFLILLVIHQIPLHGQWEIQYHEGTSRTNKVRFQSADEGLFMGDYSSVLKTSDGGLTWNKMKVGSEVVFQDFQQLNDTVVFGTGFSYEGAGRDLRSWLYESTDGGDTWAFISVLPGLQMYSQWFFNEQVGVLAGCDGIYRTSDHGQTWMRTLSLSSLVENELFFVDDSHGYVSEGKNLLKSTDQGQSWFQVLSLEQNLIHDIYFITDRMGFLGVDGSIYRTQDGGDTWSEVPLVEHQATIDIDFVSENEGYALSAEICPCLPEQQDFFSSISKTEDGGLTWKSYEFAGTLYSIDFISDQLGYASGEGNLIMRFNGGNLGDFPEAFPAPIINAVTASFPTASFYPNPVTDKMIIDITDPSQEIHIYALNGMAINLPFQSNEEHITIDFSSQQAGIYLLHIESSGDSKVFKIVKE